MDLTGLLIAVLIIEVIIIIVVNIVKSKSSKHQNHNYIPPNQQNSNYNNMQIPNYPPPQQQYNYNYPIQTPDYPVFNNIENEPIEPDIPEIYPYHKKYLLTKNEYYFYNRLNNVVSPLKLQILAKIRLADLIEVDKNAGKDYMKYFAKIKAKHIDFAIADNMKIIALLELDDKSHQNQDRQERDSFVNNALLKAGYTVIRTNGNLDVIEKALIDKGYHINLYSNTNN